MSDSEPELRKAPTPASGGAAVPTPPPTTDTDALESLAVLFQDSTEEREIPRKQVVSWAFWDWATQPFNSVILTFVFAALYLVSDSFLPADVASLPDDSPVKEAALADLTSAAKTPLVKYACNGDDVASLCGFERGAALAAHVRSRFDATDATPLVLIGFTVQPGGADFRRTAREDLCSEDEGESTGDEAE